MAAFIKFLFVIVTGSLGTVVAWFGFTDRAIVPPSLDTRQQPDLWRPLANLAFGFVGGIAGGAGIVAALPKKDRSDEETRRELAEIKDMMAAILAAKNGKAPDAARAEAKAEAIQRTLAEEPKAARELAEGDTAQGFDDLEVAARADMANAARKWRDIGALAYDADPARALKAYREAIRLDASDFSAWIYLARLEQSYAGNTTGARAAAQSALEKAGDAREIYVALVETGDVAVQAGDLAGAKAAYAEGLELARALSASNPGSAEAKRDVIVSCWNLAQLTGDKAWWREALPIVEDMAAKSQLAPTDAYMLDHIHKEAAP